MILGLDGVNILSKLGLNLCKNFALLNPEFLRYGGTIKGVNPWITW